MNVSQIKGLIEELEEEEKIYMENGDSDLLSDFDVGYYLGLSEARGVVISKLKNILKKAE